MTKFALVKRNAVTLPAMKSRKCLKIFSYIEQWYRGLEKNNLLKKLKIE